MDPDVVEIPLPIHQKPCNFKKQKQTVFHDVIDLEGDDDLSVLGETSHKRRNKGKAVVSPDLTTITNEPENETLKKLRSFKQFDIVADTSGHHFVKSDSSMKQNPTSWAKKIQEEWKILEKHLPETIFVRVFESRMDLLRAVIIGAEGTPYEDGLFFFDVQFPSGYPNVPPKVHYHSGGLRLNPNLYDNGYVCLSLLNTWSGNMNEMWTPSVSTLLQVLVSIQGLILNAKPYFNEPGYAYMSGSQSGEAESRKYNEETFILSVRTMMYTIKKPPKNFEELVVGHFYSRAHDILASCKAYMEGVQVGCYVKGGVRDVAKRGRKSSDKFKADLRGPVKLLVKQFEKLGVKDCKTIMSPTPPEPTPPKLTTPKPTPLKKIFTSIFDIVVDTSDHHYVKNNSAMKQNPKRWVKKIHEEWTILEKHLPETIFVRVFESRMDLLRAVIIGAEGTPYHDGLFFFDVFFPSGYPNEPPQVYYHSGGLRLNPNLYDNGYVCLSLLNTWSGRKNEKWTPGVSTMLQVLVSLQGLILNGKPFFNEPGYAKMSGTRNGEVWSLKYNEDTFILSVRTMMYTMKKPPKNFKKLVVEHFYNRAHDILASCKAYVEGVQVGCFVKGGVRDVDKGGRKSSSKFKADLLGSVKLLVQEFEKLGVKDCQKFMFPTPPERTPLEKLFTLCFFLGLIAFMVLKIFNCVNL
ncbi:ubiquitin-conjugating enzyme [Trifolium repens]|nr:ubiquitin-conjugating enzyme [Trifolium repens]